MKSILNNLKKIPLFPVIPLVPAMIVGGMVAMSVMTLAKVRRISRSLDELRLHPQGAVPAIG